MLRGGDDRDRELEGGLEWAAVAPGTVVVATADAAWLHRPDLLSGDAFSTPMHGPGTKATTKNLLDAAVGAAQRAAVRPSAPPPLTPARWVYRLSGYYQTTHATPRLMAEASARFRASGREALARWAESKVRDERGHDELALRDIRAMGYDAEAVVNTLVPTTAAALVRYFTSAVRATDPIGCVGYAYALERLALGQDAGYVKRVEALLPKGVTATRCLRVHSAAGSDARHVDETALVVSGLDAPERAQIALACYETTALCYSPSEEGFLSEDALQQALAALTARP